MPAGRGRRGARLRRPSPGVTVIAAPAGPRDGLRARQPPPVHEPPGSAAADRVPARWRRSHRARSTADRSTRRASPRMPAPSRRRLRKRGCRAPCRSPARSTRRCRRATSCPYGRELMDQGLEAAAIVAFERAAQANPSASTLYRLGTLLAKTGEPGRARAAYERRARPSAGSRRSAQRSRRASGAGRRPRRRRSPASGPALAATPDYPDALNNLGYALLLMGRGGEAAAPVRAGARAAARLPRGAQQPGPAARPGRRPGRGRALLPRRPARSAIPTGRRPATWRWCWSLGARPRRRPALLEAFLVKAPAFERRLRDAGQAPPQQWPDGTKDLRSWSACSSATRPTPSRLELVRQFSRAEP